MAHFLFPHCCNQFLLSHVIDILNIPALWVVVGGSFHIVAINAFLSHVIHLFIHTSFMYGNGFLISSSKVVEINTFYWMLYLFKDVSFTSCYQRIIPFSQLGKISAFLSHVIDLFKDTGFTSCYRWLILSSLS